MALLENLLKKSDAEIDDFFKLKPALLAELKDLTLRDETYHDGLTSSEALYTSYRDYNLVREDLEKRGVRSFADLGAGVSRSLLLFHYAKSPVDCSTYEVVAERVESAKVAFKETFKEDPTKIFIKDLSQSKLPEHDAYFIYLPVGKTLNKIISGLRSLPLEKEILLYVIESHGDLISYLRYRLPELREVDSISLSSKRHNPELKIYSFKRSENFSKELIKKKKLAEEKIQVEREFVLKNTSYEIFLYLLEEFSKTNTFADLQVKIREDWQGREWHWIACAKGLSFGVSDETLESIFPPRILKYEKIISFYFPTEEERKFIQQRRKESSSPKAIRKIFLHPRRLLELRDGSLEQFSFRA